MSWDLINPARVPQIAAARDRYERAGDAYLIALRDLRLEVQTAYFALQQPMRVCALARILSKHHW